MSETDRRLPFDRPNPLDPPHAYAELRGSEPVARVTTPDGRRAWLVTSYEAAAAALADPRLGMTPSGTADPGNDTLFQDGDAHTRLRRLVAKAFTPRSVAAVRPRIEELAAAHVESFADAGPPADLVAGLASPLSLAVIGELLGVEVGERERFSALAEAVGSVDFHALENEEQAAAAMQAWSDLTGYAAGLVAAKRGDLGDDLLSGLISVRDADDGRLGGDELTAMATTLVVAGYQTSRNALSVGVIRLLAEGRLAGLADAGADDVATAVEEVLRQEAGVIAEPFPRWAHADFELDGVPIAKGDAVLVRLEAANRDPAHFPDPDRFLPKRRSASPHLSFGRGPHHCLGAAPARIELGAALVCLARRLPGLRLETAVEDLAWVRGETDAGPTAVPVTW
ncbi:cytochrome P450 [Streptomonospora wellingtoniae]|uniref:Cytochrome P450 n=1 Tax=Streptomonospora wellingtoniae TaxID=3075544 RepID=A0ABU2L0U3_9ACTN|nr:cytochrome P450 [Streptomonospora sp. DSM 45055]MDT0305180.1 cytochrome P450 [Streptomonospora sp. DSM 45055]